MYGTEVRTYSNGAADVQSDGYDGTDGIANASWLHHDSGSSTPTSAGSYTEADMFAKLGVAADSSDYFKVKEIITLLLTKGVTPRGKKAQKCKQVALTCSADEVQAFRAKKEAETLAAAKQPERDPGQLTLGDAVKRLRAHCTHDWVRELPPGPRDNGEYRDVCRLCNAER